MKNSYHTIHTSEHQKENARQIHIFFDKPLWFVKLHHNLGILKMIKTRYMLFLLKFNMHY